MYLGFKPRQKGKRNESEAESESDGAEMNQQPPLEEIIPPPLSQGEMPTYFHIGRLAKDCLVTGFKIGAWHFDCTSRVSDKLSFHSFGAGKPRFRNVSGGVGMVEKFGMFDLLQLWKTDGIFGTVGVRTEAVGGMINATFRGSYERNAYKVNFQTGYEHTPIKFDLIVPILNEPKFLGYVMLQPAKNFMLAYRVVYDINEKKFDTHAIGAGYNNESTEVGLKLENFQDVRGSYFQRLGDSWAFALKATLYGEEAGQFAVGGQYQLNDNSLIKAMVRNDWHVGLVYKLMLGESIGIMYHFGLDASSPIQGDHKIGISWSLNG